MGKSKVTLSASLAAALVLSGALPLAAFAQEGPETTVASDVANQEFNIAFNAPTRLNWTGQPVHLEYGEDFTVDPAPLNQPEVSFEFHKWGGQSYAPASEANIENGSSGYWRATVNVDAQEGYNAATASFEFIIRHTTNEWETAPADQTIDFGQEPTLPKAKYGQVQVKKVDGEPATELPTAVGTHSIQWIVPIDETLGYSNTLSGTSTLTINKVAKPTMSAQMEGWTYGEEPKAPVFTHQFGAQVTSVAVYPQGKDNQANRIDYKTPKPLNAGEYFVRGYSPDTSNYGKVTASADFVVEQVAPQNTDENALAYVSMPKLASGEKVYDGEAITFKRADVIVTPVANAQGEEETAHASYIGIFAADDTAFENRLTEIRDAGDYVVRVHVKSDNLETGKPVNIKTVGGKSALQFKFSVKAAENGWTIDGADVEGLDDVTTKYAPTMESEAPLPNWGAKSGEPVQVFFKQPGTEDEWVAFDEFPRPVKVGEYTLRVINESKNYSKIQQDVKYTVEQAENSYSFDNGGTPLQIGDWTYGETPDVSAESAAEASDDTFTNETYFEVQGGAYADWTKVDDFSTLNAGTYEVRARVAGNENWTEAIGEPVEVTVHKADIVSAALSIDPEEKTYDGKPVEVKVIGFDGMGEEINTDGVRVLEYFKVKKDGTEVPLGEVAPVDAGNYLVRGMIQAGTNYNESEWTEKLGFKIKKAETVITAEPTEFVWNGEAQRPEVKSNNTDANAELRINKFWKKTGESTWEVVAEAQSDAGYYRMKVVSPKTKNFKKASEVFEYEIAPAQTEIKVETPATRVADGTVQQVNVVVLPEAVPYTLVWKTKAGNELPTAPSEPGDYTVVALVEGTDNYTATSASQAFSITAAPVENSWVEGPAIANWIAGQKPSAPVAKAAYGDVVINYIDSEGKVSSEQPTAVGEYTAFFEVAETESYTGLKATVKFSIEAAPVAQTAVLLNDKGEEAKQTYVGKALTVKLGGVTLPESLKGAMIAYTFNSEPVALGTADVDVNGASELTFAVPNVPVGAHTVTASVGGIQIASLPIEVLADPAPAAGGAGASASGAKDLAQTGAASLTGLAALALLASAGGAVLIARRRNA